MPGWDEVLKDKTKFPDTMSIPVAEGLALTMGELRMMDAKRRQQLDEQAQTLDRAAVEVAKLYQQAEKSRAATPPTPEVTATPSDNLENDPLFGAVVQQFNKQTKALEERLAESISRLDKMPATMNELIKVYETDRMSTIFESLPDRPSDLTLERLAQYAIDNGIKDKVNRLDLRRAYENYRQPELTQQRIEAARKEGMELGKKSAAVESAPKPRFIKPAADGKQKHSGSVREAIEAMRGDKEIMANLNESLAAMGTN